MGRIIFLNIGWMDSYKGVGKDKVRGGGQYVKEEGWGHELYNFRPIRGKMYGFVQPNKTYGLPATINLERLGATPEDNNISGVTVIWTKSDPRYRGTYIIGWYRNATVFRFRQNLAGVNDRTYKGEAIGYFVSASVKNCTLLSIEERVFPVKRNKKGWMGKSNVWYANEQPHFVAEVLGYVQKGKIPHWVVDKRQLKARQPDITKRIEVERAAVRLVSRKYLKLGFLVRSVEKDNVGWDLEASNRKMILKLEVKGLSGTNMCCDLTPNEFRFFKSDKEFYRLCVVTNALSKPKLRVFAYSLDSGDWVEQQSGEKLIVEKLVAARMSI